MKAIAVFPNERRIALIDNHPEPNIVSPTDVKLQILEVGVCGTDRDICNFAYGTPPEGSDYLVIGHESIGRVVAIGSAVTKFAIGDLVVPQVRRPCEDSDCAACRAGRQDFCYSGHYKERGIKELHGFMAEYVVDDEQYMLLVPQNLENIGVLTEPLTIAEKALHQINSIQTRFPWECQHKGCANSHDNDQHDCHQAVVLGAGPVGLLGAMTFVNKDYDTVVYSKEATSSVHAKIATDLGARYVSSDEASPQQLADSMKNIDVVYEATGVPSISFQLMDVLGINGIFALTGIPRDAAVMPEALGTLMKNLVLKNQSVVGSVNASYQDFEAAIDDLGQFKAKWPTLIDSLIVRFPMEQYEALLMEANSNFKNVLTITE